MPDTVRMFRKSDRLPNRRHFLVIGAPRSGTTLLATMIGRHYDVGIVNEDTTGKGLRKVLGKSATGNKLCVPNQIQLKRRNIFAQRWLKKVGLLAEAPKSVYSIEDYLQLPNLRIIAIIRDGNDTISSMVNRGESRSKKASQRWSQAVETIHEVKTRYPDRVLVVAFEELVLKPEASLETICRFLELPFQKQMLEAPRYNPKYPQAKLDEEKVHRYKKGGGDFRLERSRPAAYRKYEELLLFARQSSIGPIAKRPDD